MDVARAKRIEKAIAQEKWEKARSIIEPWLRDVPDDHWLLTRLALTYYEQKKYAKALHYDLEALQIAPYCPLAVWGYAGTLEMLGRKKEALSIFRWLAGWGEDYLADEPCGEGIRSARSLITDCYYRIGRILEQQRQWKRATAAYKEHLSRRGRGIRSIYSLLEVRQRYTALLSR